MNIFESLENLEVSEACFDEIIGLVEEEIEKKYRSGLKDETIDSFLQKRGRNLKNAIEKVEQEKKKAGMRPFEYGALPKKVAAAVKDRQKAETKLKRAKATVNNISRS